MGDTYDNDDLDENLYTFYDNEGHSEKAKTTCSICSRPMEEGRYITDLEHEVENLTTENEKLRQRVLFLESMLAQKDKAMETELNTKTSSELVVYQPTQQLFSELGYHREENNSLRHNLLLAKLDKEKQQVLHDLELKQQTQSTRHQLELRDANSQLEIANLTADLDLAYAKLSRAGIPSARSSIITTGAYWASIYSWLCSSEQETFSSNSSNTRKLGKPMRVYSTADGQPFQPFSCQECVVVVKTTDDYIFGGTTRFLFTLHSPSKLPPQKFNAKFSARLQISLDQLVWAPDLQIDCVAMKGKVAFPQNFVDVEGGLGAATFCGQSTFDVKEMEIFTFV